LKAKRLHCAPARRSLAISARRTAACCARQSLCVAKRFWRWGVTCLVSAYRARARHSHPDPHPLGDAGALGAAVAIGHNGLNGLAVGLLKHVICAYGPRGLSCVCCGSRYRAVPSQRRFHSPNRHRRYKVVGLSAEPIVRPFGHPIPPEAQG